MASRVPSKAEVREAAQSVVDWLDTGDDALPPTHLIRIVAEAALRRQCDKPVASSGLTGFALGFRP